MITSTKRLQTGMTILMINVLTYIINIASPDLYSIRAFVPVHEVPNPCIGTEFVLVI